VSIVAASRQVIALGKVRSNSNSILVGIPTPNGTWTALCHSTCISITLRIYRFCRSRRIDVHLVSPAQFTTLTGEAKPPPLDLGSGYGGWRLPLTKSKSGGVRCIVWRW
jgi:hypothetical protein